MFSPVFTINNDIIKNISLIEAAKAVIEDAPLIPAYERQFRKDAMIRTVHYGTRIEGNDLTYQEVAKLVEGDKITAGDRDIQEVINYRNVVNYLEELWSLYDANMPLPEEKFEDKLDNKKLFHYSETIIKKLHSLTTFKIISASDCGKYRHQQVVLKNTKTGEIAHRPPPAIEVPYLITDFISWLNNPTTQQDIHPSITSAITHYILVAIHPFIEGNGRVSRSFSMIPLYVSGYDIKRLFSLEEHFDRNIEDYYNSIQQTHEKSSQVFKRDLTDWINYYTQALAIELSRVKQKVKNLSRDLKLKQKLGGKQIHLSDRQIKLIEFMQRFGGLSMPDAKEILPMVSDDTIWRDLKKLMEDGVVNKHGSTKGAYYALTE